jgi:uncharacterized Tic20 family protein
MNKCPDCNNELKGIDTRGVFAFESRTLRITWVISFTFIIIVCSALILVLLPESAHSIASLIYFPVAFFLLYKTYQRKLDTVVYECVGCKERFKGKKLEKYRYGS